VVLEPHQSGLPKTSVVNMTQMATLNKTDLLERVHALSAESMAKIEDGLRLVQGIS
jgi:mRNA interferase MazF